MKYIRHLRSFALGLSAMMLSGMYGSTVTRSLPITRSYNPDGLLVSSFSSPDGTDYLRLDWEGLHPETCPGAPMLPADNMFVEIPLEASNFSITVEGANYARTISLNDSIMPVQQPQVIGEAEGPFTYPEYDRYLSFNGPRVEIGHTSVLGGVQKILSLRIYPYSIRHNQDMELYDEISFSISYDLHGASALNHDSASGMARVLSAGSTQQTLTAFNNISTYFIIAPEAFHSSLERLKNWKVQKGYDVKLISLEEIFAQSKYVQSTVDRAEGLRKYLKDQFDIYGAYFCLLVGDENANVPIRKVMYRSNVSTNNTEGICPTDIYFSDLTENWSLTQEPITGSWSCSVNSLYKRNEYSPDIIVGRLLCSTTEQIDNYMDKLILYEANPGLGDNVYLSSVNFFKSAAKDIADYGEDTYEEWGKFFTTKYYRFPTVGFQKGGDGIKEMIKAGINSWYGHGLPYSIQWGNNHYITSLDKIVGIDTISGDIGDIEALLDKNDLKNGLDNLNNRWKPSVIYSMACDNAPYDIMYFGKYTFDPMYSMAEVFTTGKHFGGPAFLGNSRVGYASCSPILENHFIQQLQNNCKIGITETLSKVSYIGEKKTYIKSTHNLIGEPEFEIWRGKPLNHSFSSSYGSLNSIFQYNSDGWKVVVSDGSDSQSTIIYDGNYLPTFNGTLLQKDYVVSAWKTGYLPFIHYYGINNTITNDNKVISVRSASLGCYGNSEIEANPFIVGNNATLRIDALDQINSSKDFIIRNGGKVQMLCFGPTDLGGTKVESNSTLDVQSREITLGKGFSVKKGATFKAGLVKVND